MKKLGTLIILKNSERGKKQKTQELTQVLTLSTGREIKEKQI